MVNWSSRPPEPNLAQPRSNQAEANYQEHVRTCRHCRRGKMCPVGRYHARKAGRQ